jgi:hypothetical protein
MNTIHLYKICVSESYLHSISCLTVIILILLFSSVSSLTDGVIIHRCCLSCFRLVGRAMLKLSIHISSTCIIIFIIYLFSPFSDKKSGAEIGRNFENRNQKLFCTRYSILTIPTTQSSHLPFFSFTHTTLQKNKQHGWRINNHVEEVSFQEP